jgi:hemerythrin superfamily protein
MATTKSSATGKTFTPPVRPAEASSEGATGENDALQLLKADHEEVATMFEEYADSEDDGEKEELAQNICAALSVHAQIEEEIFYPAAREVLEADELELVNEADVEHATIRELVSQIEASDATDEHFDAMIKVLGEYVKHHVREEESELFPRLEASELDRQAVGNALAARKAELLLE